MSFQGPRPAAARPHHPFGPNIGPCEDETCQYCKGLQMDDHERVQREMSLMATIRNLQREVETERQIISSLRERIRVLEHQRDLALWDGGRRG